MKKEYSFIIMLLAISLLSTFALADVDSSKIVSISLVNQDPDPAIAGDIVEIRLGIENKGGAAIEDIVIEVDPEYPFELVSGENPIEEIGTLKPYQSGSDIKIIKYMLRVDRDAIAGQYELRILQYGPEGKDVWYGAKTVNLDIKSKESAEVIYIDQVELLPGEITPMTFTINNVGSSPLRDLTFHWENEEGVILPVGSDDTKYIKYIEIGESAELVYNVIASANAEPDLYKLQLSLKYDDSITGEENEIATSAGVYIGGKTDFDVTFS
ncbi:MAG: COG1361 S-layer family protein, partial [Nanoarchaeota archaeon]|nr:COG1361 S-layer family protein [Nanoarchaeota archaeon]